MTRSPALSRLREPNRGQKWKLSWRGYDRPGGRDNFGKSELGLDSQPKSVLEIAAQHYAQRREVGMSDRDVTHSDLVEIAKRNGDFRKNYGLIVGAILYLRSINAARPRLFWQTSIASIAVVWGLWWR
jgi:hypothetical protein